MWSTIHIYLTRKWSKFLETRIQPNSKDESMKSEWGINESCADQILPTFHLELKFSLHVTVVNIKFNYILRLKFIFHDLTGLHWTNIYSLINRKMSLANNKIRFFTASQQRQAYPKLANYHGTVSGCNSRLQLHPMTQAFILAPMALN